MYSNTPANMALEERSLLKVIGVIVTKVSDASSSVITPEVVDVVSVDGVIRSAFH